MPHLLTPDDYRAIAASLDLPRSAFIDGRFRPGNGGVLRTLNPATSHILAEIAACDASDVDLAVAKAREAFELGTWSRLHPAAREDVLIRFAKLLTRNARELAVLESLDSGKPVRDCATIDLPETIRTIKWHAETADKIYDQTAPAGEDALARDVGPGGHYLGHPHTQANFQHAFFMPKLLDNSSVEQWMAEGSKEITERALIEAAPCSPPTRSLPWIRAWTRR